MHHTRKINAKNFTGLKKVSTLPPVITNMGYDDDTDANDGHDDDADDDHPGTEYPAILTCWSSTQNQP